MKIVVFGAGAVGGHIAARMAAAGAAISVVARGAHLAAIRSHGITLKAGNETLVGKVDATDDARELGSDQDLVIIAIKSTLLAATLPAIAPLIGSRTRVVFAMNGLPWWFCEGLSIAAPPNFDPGGVLDRFIPRERLIWCVVHAGGTIMEPGVIVNTTPGKNALALGYSDGREDEPILAAAQLFNEAGLPTTVSPEIRTRIWLKLLMNAAHSMVATATDRSGVDTVLDPETRALTVACMHEILAVGRAIGLRVEADPVALTEPSRHSTHRTSFLQDLKAGRPLELATTVLAVRDIARACDIATPHLSAVAAIVAALSADASRTAA